MKKLTILIITLTIFFSTINNSFAEKKYSEGYIEKFLDLNIGVEKYNLNLIHIEQIYFKNHNTQILFEKFKITSGLLNKEIIKKYRELKFEYYQINGIISNQKKFIYHINRFFYYLSLKEQNHNYIDTPDFILKHYTVARTYYKRLQALINK